MNVIVAAQSLIDIPIIIALVTAIGGADLTTSVVTSWIFDMSASCYYYSFVIIVSLSKRSLSMRFEEFSKEQEMFGYEVCRRVIFAATEMHQDEFRSTDKPALVLIAIRETAQQIFKDEIQMLKYRFEEDLGI